MNYDREEIYLQHKIRDAESSIEKMQRDVEFKIKHSQEIMILWTTADLK
jgi:hypothetical protein